MAAWRLLLIGIALCALIAHQAEAGMQYSPTPGTGYQPLDAATVKGKINVRLVPDPAGGTWTFKLDGAVVGTSQTVVPIAMPEDTELFDTTSVADGSHQLVVTASGQASQSATFTVSNAVAPPPPVACAPPATPSPATARFNQCAPPSVDQWGQGRACTADCAGTTWVCDEWTPTAPGADDCKAAVLPPPPPPQAQRPACWPLKQNAKLEIAGVEYVAFWACDLPKGVSTYALFFDWAKAAAWATQGLRTAAEYDAAFATVGRALTADEAARIPDLVSRYGPRAVVAANGTSLTRPVYAANADGTRNPAALPSTQARVAVGAGCNTNRRLIDAAGKGTAYYSVEGRENVATVAADQLGPVYALCTRSDPVGTN